MFAVYFNRLGCVGSLIISFLLSAVVSAIAYFVL